MANLTNAASRTFEMLADEQDYPMAAAKIYQGSALSDAGSPGAATNVAETLVAGENFLGFANTTIDNSGGTAGSQTIDMKCKGTVLLVVAGLAATSLGASVYASDGNTFTLTAAANSKIGVVKKILSVSAGTALVSFSGVQYRAG
ncbi:MAG: hypothetical protein M3O30_17400 [Planctomycetota bacterium]|nr:hypothetical protein [Planctomycetota bacterium]